MKHFITVAAVAAIATAPAAFAGGSMTGGATEWTQIANNTELIAQVSEAVDTTANTLMTAQQTMQMLRNLPETVVNELTAGLPVEKVQALASAYQTMTRAGNVYRDAVNVLEQAKREGENLKLKPADYLRYKAAAAQKLGGVYQQSYESEIAKLNRLSKTAADVQKQATTVRGINSNVGGLQALASQNMQVQALLGDISSSIAQANANAAMEAQRTQEREQQRAEGDAKFRDARNAAVEHKDAAPTLKMPSDYRLVK
ncbi:hypothetical protein [Diaphorobacter sp.]|uniref:hypothetical protein n=1 Tax=Diaphorobacter sp. TaxID=1934310 RepID=UPI002585C436|nr:hypothetical protein [Diaphorobacter sp.]